jgi:hypothetical protein
MRLDLVVRQELGKGLGDSQRTARGGVVPIGDEGHANRSGRRHGQCWGN